MRHPLFRPRFGIPSGKKGILLDCNYRFLARIYTDTCTTAGKSPSATFTTNNIPRVHQRTESSRDLLILLDVRVETLRAGGVHTRHLNGREGGNAKHHGGHDDEEGNEERGDQRCREQLITREDAVCPSRIQFTSSERKT